MTQAMLWLLGFVGLLLGFTLAQPWLYVAGAGLLLVLLLVVLIGWLRRQRRQKVSYGVPPPPTSPEQELKALGILEVRPRPKKTSAETPSTEVAAAEVAETEASEEELAPKAMPPRPADQATEPPATSEAEEDPVLTHCLEALRAALGAQTVALLVQEDVALAYRVLGISSQKANVRTIGTFSTAVPLLVPSMVDRSVSVREVSGEFYEALGYYTETPPHVAELALSPVPFTREGALYFLLADASEPGQLDRLSASTLLVAFGQLIATILELQQRRRAIEAQRYRPRREIIAEEMERARRLNEPLALALVHLNQADAIAAEGPVVLAAAEQALKRVLQESAPDQRVERFGELTYGVFYRAPVPEVEAWAARLQAQLAESTGWLEGGVSIGVAVLQERHQTPDQLRADATEALREAYETGTCTILE